MARAAINGEVLAWAIDRAEMPPDLLADRLNVSHEAMDAWLEGEAKPTFKQAQNVARILGVPFGYLFLRKPPTEDEPIADFRTVGDSRRKLDANTRNLLRDTLYKRDWFRDYRHQIGFKPLPFVNRFTLDDDPKRVAQDIKDVLFEGEHPQSGDWESHLRQLMQAADAAGIWVMRTGVVGNNTQRPLSVERFRGIAITDELVPLVLINGTDSKSAQIFTLVHELAHLWIGKSGVSNVNLEDATLGEYGYIERFCNKVAAEFLTPEAEFRSAWHDGDGLQQLDDLARHFRVSRVVIARRARDLRLIDADTYRQFFATEQARWKELDKTGGGDFYRNVPARHGRDFTFSVASEAMRGNLLLRNAANLLDVKPHHISKLYHQMRA